jgi:hypothetical protein
MKLLIERPQVVDLSLKTLAQKTKTISSQNLSFLKEMILTEGSLDGVAELIEYFDFGHDLDLVEAVKPLNEYSDFIKDRLLDLLLSLKVKEEERSLIAVQKSIGFGPGLTPSTDDFLTGIICVLYISDLKGEKQLLGKIKDICRGKTTKISEEMIHHACDGYVAESYKNFIDTIINDNKADLGQVIKQVMQMGSSSGTDFLSGFYCMAMIKFNN